MSKEEIEEAKERSKRILIAEKGHIKAPIFLDDLEVLLQALDNSIDKKVIKAVLEDYQERKRYYDDNNIANDEEYCRIEGIIKILNELLEGK